MEFDLSTTKLEPSCIASVLLSFNKVVCGMVVVVQEWLAYSNEDRRWRMVTRGTTRIRVAPTLMEEPPRETMTFGLA